MGLGPRVDQDLEDMQVAKPGRQEKSIHPKLGERTWGGGEENVRRCDSATWAHMGTAPYYTTIGTIGASQAREL